MFLIFLPLLWGIDLFWLYCGGTQTLVFGNGGIGVEEARICGLKWSLLYVLGVISVNGTKLEMVRKRWNGAWSVEI